MGNAQSLTQIFEKVLSGERDFNGVVFPSGAHLDAHELYGKVQTYISDRVRELRKNPIDISNAKVENVYASSLRIPFVKAIGASFENSCLPFLDISYGDISESDFSNTNMFQGALYGAKVDKTRFYKCTLYQMDCGQVKMREVAIVESNCRDSDFSQAQLSRPRLIESDFSGSDFVVEEMTRPYIFKSDFTKATMSEKIKYMIYVHSKGKVKL